MGQSHVPQSPLRFSATNVSLAWAAAALGMLLRLALSAASRGTNDIDTWENFALHANKEGVLTLNP